MEEKEIQPLNRGMNEFGNKDTGSDVETVQVFSCMHVDRALRILMHP